MKPLILFTDKLPLIFIAKVAFNDPDVSLSGNTAMAVMLLGLLLASANGRRPK
jgi:hypothetical protein